MEPELPIPSPSQVTAPASPTPIIQSGAGLLPVPGDVSQVSSGAESSLSRKVATPGMVRAGAERLSADSGVASANAQRIGAADASADAMKLKQDADNIGRRKDMVLDQIATKDAVDILKRKTEVERAAQNAITAQEHEYRQMSNESFWADQKTWQKVVWGASLALGAYGAALSRSENPASAILLSTINKWSDRRDAQMKQLHGEILAGRAKLPTVGADFAEREMKLKELRGAAAKERVADLLEQQTQKLAAAGDKDAVARGAKAVADLRADAAKDRQTAAGKEEQAQQFLAPTASGGAKSGSITQTVPPGTAAKGAVLDRKTGQSVGNAPLPAEGQKSREAVAQLKPLETGLGKIEKLVGQSTFWDRAFGSLTDRQQKIEGLLNPLIPMISQITGSGTPQEGEAKRLLNTIRVSISQNKDVSLENVRQLRNMLQQSYDERAKSLVPGYAGPKADASKSSDGGARKMVNGKPARVYADGTFEYE